VECNKDVGAGYTDGVGGAVVGEVSVGSSWTRRVVTISTAVRVARMTRKVAPVRARIGSPMWLRAMAAAVMLPSTTVRNGARPWRPRVRVRTWA